MVCVTAQTSLYSIPFNSVQFSSVTQSCPTLCDPMKCSTPDLPVHHQLQESTQSLVHHIDDAIQPSHPLSSPSPPALNLSQHQGLFQWVSSSHQVAKVLGVSASTSVLPMNTQYWSTLRWTGWISWHAVVHGVAKNRTRLINWTELKHALYICLNH